jgi:YaiO family outer membrane protein
MISARRLLIVPVALLAAPVLAIEPTRWPDRETAQLAYVSGDYTASKQTLETLLAANPDDPDLLRRLAAVDAAMGDLASARKSIDRALSLAPDDGDIQLARAYILLWSNEITAAHRQAEELAASRPEYPGLAEFSVSLDRVQETRALKLRSLHAGTSLSNADFSAGQTQTWFTQRAAAAVSWAVSSGASLEIEREDREQTDTQFRGRVDLPLSSDRIFITASVTPNPDFRSNWSIGAGGEIAHGDSGELLLDASFAEYSSNDVVALGAGYRHRFSAKFSASARTIHLFGGGEDYRLGGVLRADYTRTDLPDLFAIIASYPDTEIDGTRQLRAIAGGAMFALSDSLQLRISGEYESRESSYKRTAIGIDLSWRPGGQR